MTMQTDDKPRLVRVTDPVEIEACRRGWRGYIGCPHGFPQGDPESEADWHWYAYAAELEKWRAGRVNEVAGGQGIRDQE